MLTNIKLHGNLGENIGSNWNLAIESASEAIHAIQTMTGKLYQYLAQKDEEGVQYRVLINGRDFKYAEKPNINNLESIRTSELMMKKKIETIDIVPILEGADIKDIIGIIAGAALIAVGIFVAPYTGVLGAALIIGGLGLIAAGIINLLSSPPKFEDFRAIGGGGRASYLFNGPINITNEGGPVPVGYGRLLVGSQVIGASYEISDQNAATEPLTT